MWNRGGERREPGRRGEERKSGERRRMRDRECMHMVLNGSSAVKEGSERGRMGDRLRVNEGYLLVFGEVYRY